MSFLEKNCKTSDKIVIICEQEDKSEVQKTYSAENYSLSIYTIEESTVLEENSIDTVLLKHSKQQLDSTNLTNLLKILKPGGKLLLAENHLSDKENIEFLLKTNGFINVISQNDGIQSSKPTYDVGSSAKLSLKKPPENVWKLEDDDDDIIDPDNLLDEEDLAKPDPSTLKVCGTTGKRKACKNCSCGLAEELNNEVKEKSNGDLPKSSCGNCYLGDAFRCGSCPYLGMPAFKPGEKIQLPDNFLKADI